MESWNGWLKASRRQKHGRRNQDFLLKVHCTGESKPTVDAPLNAIQGLLLGFPSFQGVAFIKKDIGIVLIHKYLQGSSNIISGSTP